MIIKFQQGGAIAPLVSYTPVTVTGGETAATTSQSAASSKDDDSEDDILKLLSGLDGLPSDMQVLASSLKTLLSRDAYSPFPSTTSTTSKYLSALTQVKTANFNKKEYDNAFDIVSKNGGINEYAITDRGQLICTNKDGDFQLLTLDQLKDKEGYSPLTNAELLQYRAYSTQLANNSSVIKIVQNGIGIESVTKMIRDAVGTLGSNTEVSEGFAKTKASKLIRGLEEFTKAQQESGDYNATVDTLYKGKLLTQSQAKQAQAALSYVYKTLPVNARTLLKTKTANGTDEEAIELVSMLLNSRLSSRQEFTLSAETPSDRKGKNGTDGSDLKANIPIQVQAGDGGYESVMTIDNAAGVGMFIDGITYEQLKTPNGEHIGKTSAENMLNNSGLRSIIKATNGEVYFGNQKISLSDLSNITYDGNGIMRANIPVNSDGSPNFIVLGEYGEARRLYEESNQTEEDKKRIFCDAVKFPNLAKLVDPKTGEIPTKYLAPFIIASGMTTDGLVHIDDNNTFLTQKASDAALIREMKTSLATGSGKNVVTPDIDANEGWYNPGDWFGMYDHIYKGNIFIPLNMNKVSGAMGGNQYLDKDEADSLEEEYQKRNLSFNQVDPSILNN